MPGAPLSLPEREEISVALIEDPQVSWAVIARRVQRHPTTIVREVTRHGGRVGYQPAIAQRAADTTLACPRARRLEQPGVLRDRVSAELGLGRSPEAIGADLAAEDFTGRACVETIYAALYAHVLAVTAKQCPRSRRVRRRSRQARHVNNRPAMPNIALRPAAVNDRTKLGHWEADQIIGANNQSSMLWLTERVTRFSIPVTMPDGYDAQAMVGGLSEGLDRIPGHLLRSVAFDQGSEWAKWQIIADTFDIACWFCDPHSPWQRGQIENLNRQWRWWFPRGTDLATIDPSAEQHAADIINGQHRRLLNYQSPAIIFAAATVQ